MLGSNVAQNDTAPVGGSVVFAPDFFMGRESLVAGLRTRRRAARAVLYRHHASHVEQLLLTILGRAGTAHVPHVFETAFGRLPRYARDEDLLPWLTQLTIRHAVSVLRKSRWLRWVGLGALALPSGKSGGLPGRLPEEATYDVLHSLPPHQALVLALHWIANEPIEVVAEVCGLSIEEARALALAGSQRFESLAARRAELRPWLSAVRS